MLSSNHKNIPYRKNKQKSQKVEATQVSINGWMEKQDVVDTYNGIFFLAIKKKEILKHSTTWMDIEDVMLSEINQSQRDKYHMIPHGWGI